MKLTLFGTGYAQVTSCYNTCFLLENQNGLFLVDGGGGNQIVRRLKDAGYRWQDIHEIFLTHNHMDHIIGILWLIRYYCQGLSRGTFTGDVTIYGHDKVISALKAISLILLGEKTASHLGKEIRLAEVKDGDRQEIIGCPVTFFDLKSTKEKQFGFSLITEDGKKLTCLGDEPYREHEKPYAENADWLMHEAFCRYADRETFKPYEKSHSTVKEACEAASALNVKNLIIYHTEDTDPLHRKETYYAEGHPLFNGTLYIPDDMEVFDL